MAQKRVLIVEDETEIRELIGLHVHREGLSFDAVDSAEAAELLTAKNHYDLFILDWMLPKKSGIDIARAVRRKPELSGSGVLMLTAKADTASIVEGLEAGADDYLTKPFEPAILIARIRALLRRSERPKASAHKVLKIGELELFPETFETKCAGEPLQLTASEFKLLVALANSNGRVLTRDSLIGQVQGEGVSVVGRTVDTHVFGLRKKLGDCSDVIETVRGIGYRVKPFSE